jgi:hypothetical protein
MCTGSPPVAQVESALAIENELPMPIIAREAGPWPPHPAEASSPIGIVGGRTQLSSVRRQTPAISRILGNHQ